MDSGSIAAAVSSLKIAGDIAVGLINLKNVTEIQAKAIELNQKIITAQHEIFQANEAQTALTNQISELKKQIAQMNEWEKQKVRYKLINPWKSQPALVYALKESCKESDTAHWICTKCYDDGQRSILQPQRDKSHFIILVCPTCKAEISTGYKGIGPPRYAEE